MVNPSQMTPQDRAKWAAGAAGLAYVKDGQTVGLGSGSTSDIFIQQLAEHVQTRGMGITCVATSERSSQLAKSLGMDVAVFDSAAKIDLAVDGADQVDAKKRLIKGYGGACTREKIVEYASDRLLIIADESKKAAVLNRAVPVEFLPFAKTRVEKGLKKLGAKKAELKTNAEGRPFMTDNGFWMLNADFGHIANPLKLELAINDIEGVLENGLFAKRPADIVIFGFGNGKVQKK